MSILYKEKQKKGFVVGFTNFDLRMFNHARMEAKKGENQRFNVGCVVAYKGHIIGRGHNSNKSHPMQKKYNRKYRSFNNNNGAFINDTIHAEVSALMNIPYVIGKDVDFSKCKIYVYRICNGKPLGYGNARPCQACLHMIKDVGIRHVFYTDDMGLSYLRLD